MKFKKLTTALIFSVISFSTYATQISTPTDVKIIKASTQTQSLSTENLSWVPLLDTYLKTGQFGKARQLAESQNPAAVIERLRPWASSGLTPAQWIYAEVLYNAGFQQESAKWAYIAFFNTRFDTHLCKNTQATNLEKSIVMSFNKVVTGARINRDVMSQAITDAITVLKEDNNPTYIEGKHPEWVCYMVEDNSQQLTIADQKWKDVYNQQLDNFIKITNSN